MSVTSTAPTPALMTSTSSDQLIGALVLMLTWPTGMLCLAEHARITTEPDDLGLGVLTRLRTLSLVLGCSIAELHAILLRIVDGCLKLGGDVWVLPALSATAFAT